jgi:predicted anti-sigma-YlaC factor YlaD
MDDMRDQGRTKEEEYFYNLNKRLIDHKRKALDGQRAEQREKELVEKHWMCCPKCGNKMEEIGLLGIMVDRCTHCSGVYFDKGELELLLESKEPKGFLGGLRRWFE